MMSTILNAIREFFHPTPTVIDRIRMEVEVIRELGKRQRAVSLCLPQDWDDEKVDAVLKAILD